MAAYNNRAQAEINLKHWHSALGDCQRVLELDVGNVKGAFFSVIKAYVNANMIRIFIPFFSELPSMNFLHVSHTTLVTSEHSS